MAQAAGNQAMRPLLERPALPPVTAPAEPPPGPEPEPAVAAAPMPETMAVNPVPIWRRLMARLPDWRD
jgi:hypothetical protein